MIIRKRIPGENADYKEFFMLQQCDSLIFSNGSKSKHTAV
jgi:hypothetical protein